MGREEGSGWGTHVYLWRIHFDVWQNQYNIVKFKNKIKLKKIKNKGPVHFPHNFHFSIPPCFGSQTLKKLNVSAYMRKNRKSLHLSSERGKFRKD